MWVLLFAGLDNETVGASFEGALTKIFIAFDVVKASLSSVAFAVMGYSPGSAFFHSTLYGAV